MKKRLMFLIYFKKKRLKRKKKRDLLLWPQLARSISDFSSLPAVPHIAESHGPVPVGFLRHQFFGWAHVHCSPVVEISHHDQTSPAIIYAAEVRLLSMEEGGVYHSSL